MLSRSVYREMVFLVAGLVDVCIYIVCVNRVFAPVGFPANMVGVPNLMFGPSVFAVCPLSLRFSSRAQHACHTSAKNSVMHKGSSSSSSSSCLAADKQPSLVCLGGETKQTDQGRPPGSTMEAERSGYPTWRGRVMRLTGRCTRSRRDATRDTAVSMTYCDTLAGYVPYVNLTVSSRLTKWSE